MADPKMQVSVEGRIHESANEVFLSVGIQKSATEAFLFGRNTEVRIVNVMPRCGMESFVSFRVHQGGIDHSEFRPEILTPWANF